MADKLIVGWMDHSETRLYWLRGDVRSGGAPGEEVIKKEIIESGAHGKREENPHKPEDMADKERMKAYKRYFAEVAKLIGRGEEHIYLLGHDQALRQFRNYCEDEAKELLERLHGEPRDRLTEPQILAYGRKQMN